MARVTLKKLLDRSDRNMAKGTHPVVRKSALKTIELAYAEGINAQISEGNRSAIRQNQLYNQGRTSPGKIVTNARAGQSWHNYGVAIDYFLTSNDGSKSIWTVNNKWRRVADIAGGLGFEWGGVWKSFVDYPHLQMTGGLSLSDLQAGKRPNLSMKDGSIVAKPSYPSNPSQTSYTSIKGNWTGQSLKNGVKGKPVTQLQTKLADVYFYPDKGAKNNGVDSYYGGDTEDAVRRYQLTKGLAVDGIAGKEVYNSLGNKKPTSKPSKKPSTSSQSSYQSVSGNWTGQTLSRGTKGEPVKQLQQRLINANFYPDKDAKDNGKDSYFGKDTEDAVRRYQSMFDELSVDGKAGRKTYDHLLGSRKSSKKSGTKIPYQLPTGSLRSGNHGERVKQLQRALNKANFKVGKVDGKYGKKTKDAVYRLQLVDEPVSKYKDGIYGARTRKYLNKRLNK